MKQLRQQSDYELKIPEKGTLAYIKWTPMNINEAFKIAEEIFDAFENLE